MDLLDVDPRRLCRPNHRPHIISGVLLAEFEQLLARHSKPGEVNGRPALVTAWNVPGLVAWFRLKGVTVCNRTVRRQLRRMGWRCGSAGNPWHKPIDQKEEVAA